MIETFIDGNRIQDVDILSFEGLSYAEIAVSDNDRARLLYDKAAKKFVVSYDGGAYEVLAGGGSGGGSGTVQFFRETLPANGSTTSFVFTHNFIEGSLLVFIDGQYKSVEYIAKPDNTGVDFLEAPQADETMEVLYLYRTGAYVEYTSETLSVNGVRTSFTFLEAFVDNSLLVFVNGILTTAYTEKAAGVGIDFTTAPFADDEVVVWYAKRSVSVAEFATEILTTDDAETSFTFTHTFTEYSLLVFINGVCGTPGIEYTEKEGRTGIDFNEAPKSDDTVGVVYAIS
jgi:hypothetical protein